MLELAELCLLIPLVRVQELAEAKDMSQDAELSLVHQRTGLESDVALLETQLADEREALATARKELLELRKAAGQGGAAQDGVSLTQSSSCWWLGRLLRQGKPL